MVEQVEIEERVGQPAHNRLMGRQADKYPFAELGLGELTDGSRFGGVSGPCFFIPGTDKPDQRLQIARKQFPDVTFVSRKATKQIDGKPVFGFYIWKVPQVPTKRRPRYERSAPPAETQRAAIEFASSEQRRPEPRSASPDETTQLVLSYLIGRERTPHKWMGRASVIRKLGAGGRDRTDA